MPAVHLTAYPVSSTRGWTIEPAQPRRDWMDQTTEKFAYRCLPLTMANQAGWVVGSPLTFAATWNGKNETGSVSVRFLDEEGENKGQISGHFGHGVVTFTLPWLFRTTPGYGLWVRGPSNLPKDSIVALDGIVETDWAPYTFTMNWRLTRRNTEVFFKKGEPMCMLVPFPLAMLESVTPTFSTLDANPVLKADYAAFTERRNANIASLRAGGPSSWSMDYMRGHLPDGTEVTEHRRGFKLEEFGNAPAPTPNPE